MEYIMCMQTIYIIHGHIHFVEVIRKYLKFIDDIESDDSLQTDADTLDKANKFNQDRTRFQKGNQQGVRFAPNTDNDDQMEIDIEEE